MVLRLIEKSDTYYLNYCAKHLARGPASALGGASLTVISEAWRFPIVDTGSTTETNCVSFVCDTQRLPEEGLPAVLGTFANLYEPIGLRRLRFMDEDTNYFAVSVEVPKHEVHRYKLRLNDKYLVDPINPQRTILEDGSEWSLFYTDETNRPVTFERWQLRLLRRFAEQLLPFRTSAARQILEMQFQSGGANDNLYRLDDSVGEVNYIDKVLARQERHHLVDYQICLREIDRVLRRRNPYEEPADMPASMFTTLHDQMATGTVPDWDYGAYGDPRYFLEVVRRHVVTGAFCHPKHGGNIGAAGFAYLAETYRDEDGKTLFAWREALEPPLGTNEDYRG